MENRKKQKSFVLSESDRLLFLDAIENQPILIKDKWLNQTLKSNVRKKKYKKINATLDLHGLTREEAGFRLKNFILRCTHLGFSQVLIIHGKGSGALREEVRSILANSSAVVMIEEAKVNQGGQGAVVVQLKKSSHGTR